MDHRSDLHVRPAPLFLPPGWTPTHLSALSDSVKRLEECERSAPLEVDAASEDGVTPLGVAVASGKIKAVR